MFISTSRDLAVHEEQRDRTRELITKFDQAGQTRPADQNRTVLAQLDERIAVIKRNHDQQRAERAGDVA